MKRILFLLLIVCFSMSLSAQKIHFTDTSNVWKELWPQYNDAYPELLYYKTFSFIRDSIIDSSHYKLFSFKEEYPGVAISFIREDTILKKVFVRDLANDSDIVFMDYNLKVGDTLTFAYNKFAVTGIDSTLIDSIWYKVWTFSGEFPYINVNVNVIEGIGCIQDPTYMLWDQRRCVECALPFMYCFSNNGIMPVISPAVSYLDNNLTHFLDNTTSCATFPKLYASSLPTKSDKFSILPNPATTSLTITSSDKITSVAFSNLLGQTVYSNYYHNDQVQVDVADLPAGLYLVRINGSEVSKFVKQ